MANIQFTETQQFRQPWLWLLILSFLVYFLYHLVFPFFNPSAEHVSGLESILSSVIFLLVIMLLYFIRLDTLITEQGVSYRFFPFHQKYRMVNWNDISKAYIRTYNPILDYGGWGLRLGIFGKGKAVNISGNKGLQLHLSDGKLLLIGTQKEKELSAVIHQIGKVNPNKD